MYPPLVKSKPPQNFPDNDLTCGLFLIIIILNMRKMLLERIQIMNKPQYLAELGRLLIFMTSADREETLSRYGTLFDLAGPDGADALISHIGSPTVAAIRLSRTYKPGSIADSVLDESLQGSAKQPSAPAEQASHGPAPEEAPAPEPPLIIDDLPGFEPPEIPDTFAADEAAPGPGPAEPSPKIADDIHTAPAPADAMPDWVTAPEEGPVPENGPVEVPEAEDILPAPAEPAVPEEPDQAPVYTVERTMPLWAGIPLFILSLFVIAIPLAAVLLVLVPVLVLPGVALLIGAWLAAVGGLWCISYIADAVMLFGLALVILAAGLVVLWLGLWLLVSAVALYIRGMRGISHLTLGKKVMAHA